MEDFQFSALKESFSSVSAKALNNSSRLILANNLDCKLALSSRHGIARDYRGLADLMGIPHQICSKFEKSESPTKKLLETWETSPDATLDKLLTFLEEMERFDVIQEIVPSLEKSKSSYLQYQRSLESPIQVAEVSPGPTNFYSENEGTRGVLTLDDLRNGEETLYDAFVSYAEADTLIVQEFARCLESPEVRLKLCIPGRDVLAGWSELDTNIELIKNRCRRMLIFLTPNFMKSPALEFQVSFAGSLAIEQRKRILIPVILSPCEIPLILSSVSKIDFTKDHIQDWMWSKLVTSLMPEENVAVFLSSLGRNPQSYRNVTYYTFPPSPFSRTGKFNIHPVGNTESPLAILSADSSDWEMKNLTPSTEDSVTGSDVIDSTGEHERRPVASTSTASPSKRLKNIFTYFKRKGNSSHVPPTISFPSDATSGFHSQSYSDCKSFDNSDNSFNGDTGDTSL